MENDEKHGISIAVQDNPPCSDGLNKKTKGKLPGSVRRVQEKPNATDEFNSWLKLYSIYNCGLCCKQLHVQNVHQFHLKNCVPRVKGRELLKNQRLVIAAKSREEETSRRELRESSVPYDEQFPTLSQGDEGQSTVEEHAPRDQLDLNSNVKKQINREKNVYGGIFFDAKIRNPLEIITTGTIYMRMGYLKSFQSTRYELTSPTQRRFSKKIASPNNLIVFSPEKNETIVLTASQEFFNWRRKTLQEAARYRAPGSSDQRGFSGCGFCKRNGDRTNFVMSHNLRDYVTKKITCPILRNHKCEICGATGDKSHTKSYCPENPFKLNMVKVKETTRNSTGLRAKQIGF